MNLLQGKLIKYRIQVSVSLVLILYVLPFSSDTSEALDRIDEYDAKIKRILQAEDFHHEQ